ncbi:hypothetical protein EI555_013797, partial [Monodon monoceros]
SLAFHLLQLTDLATASLILHSNAHQELAELPLGPAGGIPLCPAEDKKGRACLKATVAANTKGTSYIQLRKGPNIVGPHGLLQPFADAIKLFTKEPLRPATSSTTIFIIAPIIQYSGSWAGQQIFTFTLITKNNHVVLHFTTLS